MLLSPTPQGARLHCGRRRCRRADGNPQQRRLRVRRAGGSLGRALCASRAPCAGERRKGHGQVLGSIFSIEWDPA